VSEFRKEFIQALELLARAFERVVRDGYSRPILVGGAAVEFYTGGAVVSGDFDIVTPAEDALQRALLAEGFRKEDRPGWLLRGYYHPELAMGVEVVGRALFDGHADEAKVLLVQVTPGAAVAMAPIEDLIADRMAQFASTATGVNEMLEQAVRLFQLAPPLDEAYLNRRIGTETAGTYDLAFLRAKVEERKR
jgi:hypothetical protein